MAQSLQIDIKTTSDVPQAMDRAKAATVGFGKQVEDIKKKFGTGFKDIFLSFLGPMALLGTAMGFIGKIISDNQKKQEDATKAAIEGTNALMSAEDTYYANKLNNEKKTREATEEAAVARAKVTMEFLKNDPRGKQIFDNAFRELSFGHPFRKTKPGLISDDPEVQAKVQALIAEDMRKNPTAATTTGSALPNSTPFKAPEGFSNVVGVGANPVLDAMTSQLAEAKRTNDLLTQIAQGGGGRTSTWLTAADSPAPSRAVMLQGK